VIGLDGPEFSSPSCNLHLLAPPGFATREVVLPDDAYDGRRKVAVVVSALRRIRRAAKPGSSRLFEQWLYSRTRYCLYGHPAPPNAYAIIRHIAAMPPRTFQTFSHRAAAIPVACTSRSFA